MLSGIPRSKKKILQDMQDRARTMIEGARIKYNWSHNFFKVEKLTKFNRSTSYKIMNAMGPENFLSFKF